MMMGIEKRRSSVGQKEDMTNNATLTKQKPRKFPLKYIFPIY